MISILPALSLFTQGFFLSLGPCLITCGPILFPYILATNQDWREGLSSTLIFLLSKCAVYVLLGLVFGYIGAYILGIYASGAGRIIWLIGAFSVIFLGVFVSISSKVQNPYCRFLARWAGEKAPANLVWLGVIVGLLPCLPLTAALLEIALLSKNIFAGALYGLFFGLGTVLSPLLILGVAAGGIKQWIKQDERFTRALNLICGIVLVLTGVYMIFMRL